MRVCTICTIGVIGVIVQISTNACPCPDDCFGWGCCLGGKAAFSQHSHDNQDSDAPEMRVCTICTIGANRHESLGAIAQTAQTKRKYSRATYWNERDRCQTDAMIVTRQSHPKSHTPQ
eukprot:1566953-Prymnesium_polylepis.1